MSVVGQYVNALIFDGVDDYVEVLNDPSFVTNTFTLMAWINVNDFGSGGAKRIVSRYDITNNFGYELNHFSGTSPQEVYGQIGDGVWHIASFNNLNTGQWYHLALTYNGSSLTTYVDGFQINSVPLSTMIIDSTTNLIIGASTSLNRNFNGLIDEVRLYNRALSLAEIQIDRDTPVGGAPAGCAIDSDCDNNIFCDGAEKCVAGTCVAGTPPTDDGVSCTADSCDEVTDIVTHTPNNTLCDNGLFCDGTETCDLVLDCQIGNPISCPAG
ncbi:MAG: LamG domain-containing protein, partial [Candidatus Nanoarchaeia archaeon]